MKILLEIKKKYETPNCSILIVDADQEHDIYNKPRTLPCFARYIFPTVGFFDGWLYNCSQSSAPNFHSSALGDLTKMIFGNFSITIKLTTLRTFTTYVIER